MTKNSKPFFILPSTQGSWVVVARSENPSKEGEVVGEFQEGEFRDAMKLRNKLNQDALSAKVNA